MLKTNTEYLLHLADNALVLGHRNSEWCGHGPILEQDIAITNISLDLIGQSRNLFQYAASLMEEGTTEDSLAYLRDASSYRNILMAELPKGDWAFTILRQFFFSAFQSVQYTRLESAGDPQLAAIATKSLKEVAYHLRWSSEWVIRLGDGTDESNRRLNNALEILWPFTAEFFTGADFETVDPSGFMEAWTATVKQVFDEATIELPKPATGAVPGKLGQHSADLVALLDEMQVLPRTYPDAIW